jgi:phosphinothricin acetyltransferase
MRVALLPSVQEDREEMAGIFNHYVEHSFATYTEKPVEPERFDSLMAFSPGWPAVTARADGGVMAGFGLVRPYSMIPAFRCTAELTCFLHPDFTGMGIGRSIIAELESGALAMGIGSILATVSSLNDGSIRFHQACGFVECGRLLQVGVKRGMPFDVVLLQKML